MLFWDNPVCFNRLLLTESPKRAGPVHEQRQSRIEVKGEKLTFHLIHIL